MGKQYISDCEGPISLDDNAFELCEHFIPNGGRFFAKISKYDDFQADIEHRAGYKAGDTLRLILPFLLAFGATDERIADYSRDHVHLVPGADKLMSYVSSWMDARIISTSYSPYIKALSEKLGFPFEHTYSTPLALDAYSLSEEERATLEALKSEIDCLDEIIFPEGAAGRSELDAPSRATIDRLDEIFFGELPDMESGALLDDVNPIGGIEKANALTDSLGVTGNRLADVIYVGDSITDVQALTMVRKAGGLAVSFNGNRYAVGAADVAVITENTDVMTYIAESFLEGGKEHVFILFRAWNNPIMKEIQRPDAVIVAETDRVDLIRRSETMRKSIRGLAGALG